MSIYLYTIFEAVIEQSSFVKAAEVLNLTPSAVSHAIAKLESDLGFQLFIRGKKGVKLTGEGETILPHIKSLQRSNENLNQVASQIMNLERGIVRIGTFNSVTVNWLPHILKSFREEHQNIEIIIQQGGYNDILEWVGNHSVDLAFIADTVLPPEMPSLPLHKDRIVCVVPKGFVTKNPDYITIEEIGNLPFVMQNRDYDQEAMRILQKYNLPVSSRFSIETDSAIIAMVEAGFGVCILTDLICQNAPDGVDVYPLLPENYRTVGLLFSNPEQLSPVVQKMTKHIIRFVQENGLDNIQIS